MSKKTWFFDMMTGRVETGDMLDSVKSAKVKITKSGKSYQSSFGWSTPDRHAHSERMSAKNDQYKSYYDLQDLGFTTASGTPVPAMHATEAGRRKFKEVMAELWHS